MRSRRICVPRLFGFLCVFSAPLLAQNATPSRLYSQATQSNSSEVPLVLRYKISQYNPQTKTYAHVDPDTVFRKNDEIVIDIVATADAYLYVVNEDLDKKVTWIFPSPRRPGESNLIKAGTSVRVPSQNRLYFQNQVSGQETLFLILSREPQDLRTIERIAIPNTSTPQTSSVTLAQNKQPADPGVSEPDTASSGGNKRGVIDRLLGRHKEMMRSLGETEPEPGTQSVFVASKESIANPTAANGVVMWEIFLKQQ